MINFCNLPPAIQNDYRWSSMYLEFMKARYVDGNRNKIEVHSFKPYTKKIVVDTWILAYGGIWHRVHRETIEPMGRFMKLVHRIGKWFRAT